MESINRPSYAKSVTRCHQHPSASPPPSKTRPSPPALLLCGRWVPALQSLKTTPHFGFSPNPCALPLPRRLDTLGFTLSAKSLHAGMVTPKVRYGYTNVLQNTPLTRLAVEKQQNGSPQLCSSPLPVAKGQGPKSVQDTEPRTQTNTAAAQPSSFNCMTESEHIPSKHLSVKSYKPRHIKDDLFEVDQHEN